MAKNRLRNNKLQVIRPLATGFYDDNDGLYKTVDSPQEFEITCSIHRVTGADLALLPDNKRQEEVLKIITSTELRTSEQGKNNADIINYNGYSYQVTNAFLWPNQIIPHCEVLATKITTNNTIDGY